jgi:hypothetical protein
MAVKKKKTTKKKSGSKPTNPALYARVKAEAKRKFKVYPSAYANGWLVKTYKARGGGLILVMFFIIFVVMFTMSLKEWFGKGSKGDWVDIGAPKKKGEISSLWT